MRALVNILKYTVPILWILLLFIGTRDPISFFLSILAFYSIYLLLSISLNLEYGFTGIPNFGKVMFYAGGAFVTGALSSRLIAPFIGISWKYLEKFKTYNVIVSTQVSRFFMQRPDVGVSIFVLMLLLGVLIGAFLGLIASYPAIRLREDYLGITLIASGELLRIIARNYDPLIAGTYGVMVPDPFYWLSGISHEIFRVGVMMSIAALTWIMVELLIKSPFGRMIRAIRDNELAAEALGKDVVKVRMKVLMIGSSIAAIAGVLYAFYLGSVQPDDFMPIKSFIVWVMVILGGAGNNKGAALGALLYLSIDRTIITLKNYLLVPFDVNNLAYIIIGCLFILVLMYRPEGLIPEKSGESIIKLSPKLLSKVKKNYNKSL